MRLGQVIASMIEVENFLVPRPCRQILYVPTELVSVDQSARRDGRANRPLQKLIGDPAPQAARGIPIAQTGIGQIERPLILFGDEPGDLRRRLTEIERNNRADASVESRSH